MAGIDNPIRVSDKNEYDEGPSESESRTKNRENSTDNIVEAGHSSNGVGTNATGMDNTQTDFFHMEWVNNLMKLKGININNYASKKSLAQGMLDLALLASNAAQLRYILTVGEAHEFYSLLLGLIITSICLQVLQVVICIILGLILDLNNINEQKKADIINNISVAIIVVIVALNVVISAFDVKAQIL